MKISARTANASSAVVEKTSATAQAPNNKQPTADETPFYFVCT